MSIDVFLCIRNGTILPVEGIPIPIVLPGIEGQVEFLDHLIRSNVIIRELRPNFSGPFHTEFSLVSDRSTIGACSLSVLERGLLSHASWVPLLETGSLLTSLSLMVIEPGQFLVQVPRLVGNELWHVGVDHCVLLLGLRLLSHRNQKDTVLIRIY